MKLSAIRLALLASVALIAATASAQSLKPNQTLGFGDNKLLEFTYTQNFDCVDQPNDDLNFNGIIAAKDPGELQIPICQVGTSPSINPPGQVGKPFQTTEPLYVLVPMFSVDNDQNPNDAISCKNVVPGTLCGPALGSELISLFGALPEAFKAKPLVYSQCPEPGSAPGTCTMHVSRLDLSKLLADLGFTGPPTANVFVPTPNHSHLLITADINLPAIWWQVIPVLVTGQSDWPTKDGSSGITSYEKLVTAKTAGTAIPAPSNFFLFFSSNTTGGHSMSQMNMSPTN
jgi:hypothetical protein